MPNFCTLSARNYLPKLLVLHESLLRHSSEPFTLHVLAMDVETFRLLHDMQLPNVNLIPLSGFESALQMKPVKASRSLTEYYWTCASSLMEYLMRWLAVDGVTYLDADTIFFANPRVIFDEIGTRSIGITPHRFPPHKRYMERNGRFNVGLVAAKNTETGIACIARWAKQCREWCFWRNDGDKFADQKFLDTWETDYPMEVCAIENIGVNVAPWNVSQWRVTEGPAVDGTPVVFYHVHELLELDNGVIRLTNYSLREEDTRFIYAPYLDAYHAAKARILECEARLATERAALELQGQRA